MSTRTTESGTPMVESTSLQLVQAMAAIQGNIGEHLTEQLASRGYIAVTPAVLSFLGALECGINYGSDIARNLGVSRQMVAKTVKDLSELGYLEQRPGPGKQKEIVFTRVGERLMADARTTLSNLDEAMASHLGEHMLNRTLSSLLKFNRALGELEA